MATVSYGLYVYMCVSGIETETQIIESDRALSGCHLPEIDELCERTSDIYSSGLFGLVHFNET